MVIIKEELKENIRNKDIISSDELFELIYSFYGRISKSYIYSVVSKMIDNEIIYRLDSKTYTTIKKRDFHYQLVGEDITSIIDGYRDYSVWDSNILNKWINHLLNSVVTFIEVDKDMINFVFEELKSKSIPNVLLNPSKKEFDKYFNSHVIVVRPLMKSLMEKNHSISIERMIVNIYADKLLNQIISYGEKRDMLNEIFKTYHVNLNKLFYIAKKKKIYQEFNAFLFDNVEARYIYHD